MTISLSAASAILAVVSAILAILGGLALSVASKLISDEIALLTLDVTHFALDVAARLVPECLRAEFRRAARRKVDAYPGRLLKCLLAIHYLFVVFWIVRVRQLLTSWVQYVTLLATVLGVSTVAASPGNLNLITSYVSYSVASTRVAFGIAHAHRHSESPSDAAVGPALGQLDAGAAFLAGPSLKITKDNGPLTANPNYRNLDSV